MICLKKANADDIEKEWLFVREMPEDENGLTNSWNGVSKEDFENKALPSMLMFAEGKDLPEGYVPETFFFLWKDDEIVGQFRIRHHLCESLRTGAGHIGYFIAKPYRGKGLGTEGLRLTLEEAHRIVPEEEIYLRVNLDNPASLHVMLNNGGRIVGQDAEHYFVRISNPGKGKYPSPEEAESILAEAEKCNPGPWGNHSRTAAHCAERIASRAGLCPEKAYVLGLLHDIGRKFGKRHLGHVSDGYSYMVELGYPDAARICLTHSFNEMKIEGYVGNFDTTAEETALIRTKLKEAVTDDYDLLIQLCDAISGAEGVMDIIDRMSDVKQRYGDYDQGKWDRNLELKALFENRMQMDLYEAVEKNTFRPVPVPSDCPEMEIIERFVKRSVEILKGKMTGIYLHGSAAMGCYQPKKSDLDFVVVVEGSMTETEKREYMDMVVALDADGPAKGIEMSIVTRTVCNPFVYPTPFILHYSRMHTGWYRKDPDDYIRKMNGDDKDLAAHFTVIRSRGICLYGLPIKEVFGDVPEQDYLDSIRDDVAGATEQIAENSMYLILNLARVLGYLKEKTVLSKKEGGAWGVKNLPAKYHTLILAALDEYENGTEVQYDAILAREYAGYMLSQIDGGQSNYSKRHNFLYLKEQRVLN